MDAKRLSNQANKKLSLASDKYDEKDYDTSEKLCFEILKKDPGNHSAIDLLANILIKKEQHSLVIQTLERLFTVLKNNADSYYHLGEALESLGDITSAAMSYHCCIKLVPGHIACLKLVNTLRQLGFSGQAAGLLIQLVQGSPNNFNYLYQLGVVFIDIGEPGKAVEMFQKALAIKPHDKVVVNNLLYSYHYASLLPPKMLFELHEKLSDFGQSSEIFNNSAGNHTKIRVGYVSANFNTHSVTTFLEPLIKNHSDSDFEIFFYYNNTYIDEVSTRLKQHAKGWLSIVDLTDLEAAKKISEDEIDILVDLSGHTGKNRLGVFALKPARAQVTWLGYPNTTGLKQMDYRLTDEIADPVGIADTINSEKLVRLPHGFLCYQPADNLSEVCVPPCTTNSIFTFGCFNNLTKITPDIISAWSEILKTIENSRLLLKSFHFSDDQVKKKYLALFQHAGINPERIVLHAFTATREMHQELYNEIDLALDTFPYSGTTTTCEALWMGVPTVTIEGDVHVARVSSSIMSRVGLHDFIVKNKQAYIEKAVSLANNPDYLSSLRESMRERMLSSDLCNGELFAQQVESAYRSMLSTE